MAQVEKFNRSMIEHFLKSDDIRHITDSDGNFLLAFGYSEKRGGNVHLRLMVGGPDDCIYAIEAVKPDPISRINWAKAIKACNWWNSEKRWPKVSLQVEDWENDQTGQIAASMYIDLSAGVHQEFINNFTRCAISGIDVFYTYLRKEHKL